MKYKTNECGKFEQSFLLWSESENERSTAKVVSGQRQLICFIYTRVKNWEEFLKIQWPKKHARAENHSSHVQKKSKKRIEKPTAASDYSNFPESGILQAADQLATSFPFLNYASHF